MKKAKKQKHSTVSQQSKVVHSICGQVFEPSEQRLEAGGGGGGVGRASSKSFIDRQIPTHADGGTWPLRWRGEAVQINFLLARVTRGQEQHWSDPTCDALAQTAAAFAAAVGDSFVVMEHKHSTTIGCAVYIANQVFALKENKVLSYQSWRTPTTFYRPCHSCNVQVFQRTSNSDNDAWRDGWFKFPVWEQREKKKSCVWSACCPQQATHRICHAHRRKQFRPTYYTR